MTREQRIDDAIEAVRAKEQKHQREFTDVEAMDDVHNWLRDRYTEDVGTGLDQTAHVNLELAKTLRLATREYVLLRLNKLRLGS